MSFDPERPLVDQIRIIENATILPYGQGRAGGIARRAGVYDATGSLVAEAQCFRNMAAPTTLPPKDAFSKIEVTQKTLPGTWLWGGLLYQHFGHFLLESTARLWAHDHTKVQGELFLLKKRMGWPNRFIKPLEPLLRLVGATPNKTRGVTEPLRVERLVVPPQGFGTGEMVAGSPEMRQFMRRRLGQGIEPKGGAKIYISRSKLFSKRGRYMAERHIETLLEAEGFTIYHPQNDPVEAQIAQYKAARVIISSDSSALHLAAFFAHPDDRVAIILRRPGEAIQDYLTQYHWFAGFRPDVLTTLTGQYWQFEGAKLGQMSEIYSALDFPKLGAELAALGYIDNPRAWTNPSAEVIEAERERLSEQLGTAIIPTSFR